MSPLAEDELKLLATLEKSSKPLSETVRSILNRKGVRERIEDLNERLSFERMAFNMAGRTIADLHLYRHHVDGIERAKKVIEDSAWEALFELLKLGNAIAFGIRVPINFDIPQIPIPRVLWAILEFDRKKGCAVGSGYKFHDVRIVILKDWPAETVARVWNVTGKLVKQMELEMQTETDEKSSVATTETSSESTANKVSEPIRVEIVTPIQVEAVSSDQKQQCAIEIHDPAPSFPGRPSMMRRIAQEMEERARTGRLLGTLHDESEALSRWAKENLRSHQVPGPKAIQNALRDRYRRLKESSSP